MADSYATRTEWQNEHPNSYAAAIRLGILNEIGPKSLRPEALTT